MTETFILVQGVYVSAFKDQKTDQAIYLIKVGDTTVRRIPKKGEVLISDLAALFAISESAIKAEIQKQDKSKDADFIYREIAKQFEYVMPKA